jgi:HrpA-like RNA helicase
MSSLKAVKSAVQKPSEVELILTDSQKLSVAPIVALCNDAFQLTEKRQELSLLSGKANQVFAHEFVNHLITNELNYVEYMAFKKHVASCVAIARKNTIETVDKWLLPLIKSYIKNDLANGYELPKSDNKPAVNKAKKEALLASLSDSELNKAIDECAKTKDFKRGNQLQGESDRRANRAKTQAKRLEAKRISDEKTDIKKWITSLDSEGLVAMMYVKNNFDTIKQMSIES